MDNKLLEIENSFRAYAQKAEVSLYSVETERIEPKESIRLKCLVPLCEYYGVCKVCPPNIPGVSQFKEALKSYDKAYIVVLQETITDINIYQTDFSAELRLAEIIKNLENLAFTLGNYHAMGLTVGGCKLCKQCTDNGASCRHPFKARPSPEGFGIDITSLAKSVGVKIEWPPIKEITFLGLMLI